jgi:Fe-S oxidoreductase
MTELAAASSCRYCPMCHHADLVTTLERRETYSARGRALLLFAAEQGKISWDAELADVMYRFFCDGLSQRVCAGHIAHDEMVIEARRRIVAAGKAPHAVAQIKANIQRTGNPWGEPEPDPGVLSGAGSSTEVLVYFGSAARIRRPNTVTALSTLLNTAGVAFSVLAEEGDPGLLQYQLGDEEAAMASASVLSAKIASSGARTVVTPDADAYRVLKAGIADVPPIAAAVLHSSELLVDLRQRLRFRPPGHLRVAYHDPCALARFSPCMDAPRRLVEAVCGVSPLEIGVWSRDLANCSGECGGMPFTFPSLSHRAAEHRIHEMRDTGADLLVTGSPASANALAGDAFAVLELSEFLAGALA